MLIDGIVPGDALRQELITRLRYAESRFTIPRPRNGVLPV